MVYNGLNHGIYGHLWLVVVGYGDNQESYLVGAALIDIVFPSINTWLVGSLIFFRVVVQPPTSITNEQ